MRSVALHSKLTRVLLKSFSVILFFAISLSSYSQDVDEARQKEGRKLFKSLCASCHKLDKKLVGPALAGVEDRRENDWLKAWIKDNAEFQKVDSDAVEAAEFSPTAMTAFPQLSEKQVDDILYYTTVGDLKKKAEVVAGGDVQKSDAPGWLIYILALAIIVAFLIIAGLLKTISELKGAPKSKGALASLGDVWEGYKQNTFLKVLTTIFLLLMGAYFTFGTLFKVGVDEGYSPLQPIAFSHKVHAGDNQIDCQYCHSSAKHSKTSGIPSVNVCMNCHKNISEVADDTKVEWDGITYGKPELDKEIAKIYEAAGFDASTFKYSGETKPVNWVKVHNLPDHVYFNHSQHVTVGGIECENCHGDVKTYTTGKVSGTESNLIWR